MSAARSRRRVSVVGIAGELLITGGVLVLLFLGWQVWLGSAIDGNSQQNQAQSLSQQWAENEPNSGAEPDTDAGSAEAPPVLAEPAYNVSFAAMIIPRFGAEYSRPVAEGIGTQDVLREGIGHYPGTQMPGAVGNAAFAAHRTGHGSPFFDIDKFQIGDSIYVETTDGWYRYAVRSLEYVAATGIDVLKPVPQAPETSAEDRILTLTSCNPAFTANERIVVYATYDTWFPRSAGLAPPEIAGLVTATGDASANSGKVL